VGPRAGLDTEDKGNILSPLPGIEPRASVSNATIKFKSAVLFGCVNCDAHGFKAVGTEIWCPSSVQRMRPFS
jgi:hypothetical protein